MIPEKKKAGTRFASERLSLILLSTEACNLRCVYCYEPRKHGRMKAPVLRGVKNLLERRAGDLEDLSISWFGGEPLLTRDVITDMQGYVHSLLDSYPRIRFRADMTTNAYLLSSKVFEDLLEIGVTKYQISFDGPRKWHDRKCTLPSGQGTFDQIWENVTALRQVSRPFHVILRIHVDEDNLEALPDFIVQCRDTFGGDSRFQFFIRPLARLGGSSDHKLHTLKGGLEDERVEELRKLASSMGLNLYSTSTPFTPCYAARPYSFIVRADGRINKCSSILEEPENQVGRLHENGTMELNKQRMLAWIRGIRTGDRGELSCPLKGFQDPCVE